MKVLIPPHVIARWRRELRIARSQEIGGVLMAEHVAEDTFRLVDISVQRSGGSAVHFMRDTKQHKRYLADFFARTGNDYQRFNYLGEWHSHPSFDPIPSGEDLRTMEGILSNPSVGVGFAALIILRLRSFGHLEMSATLFRQGQTPQPIDVQLEEEPPTGWISRLLRVFGISRDL